MNWDFNIPICSEEEADLPKNRLFSLAVRLKNIHPTYEKVGFDDGSFLIYFSDGPPMEVGEFEYDSQTRIILEEMMQLIEEIQC